MVKGGFSGNSGNCGKPADARVSRGSGVLVAACRMDADALPNLSGILFPLVYSGFRRFLICFTYSLTLLSPLFPGVPEPYVVIYVVKNASRPVSGECSPTPDGKHFSLLCGLYCNSEQTVMQVVSAWVVAQRLSRNRQRNSENGFFKNIKGDCFYYPIAIY